MTRSVCLMAAMLGTAQVAHAQPAPEAKAAPAAQSSSVQPTPAPSADAALHFRRGTELYEDGDFSGALIEFRRAYDMAPNSRVLYNIGQASYQLQNYAAALAAFERYLAEAGNQVSAERRKEVEADVAKLRNRIAKLVVRTNVDGADVAVDDVSIGKTPFVQPAIVSAGRRKITVSKDGYDSAVHFVELAGGDAGDVQVDLAPRRLSTPREPSRPGELPLWAPWAVTGALGAATAVTGVLALGASSDLRDRQATFGETPESLQAAATRTTTYALVTDVLLGATVVSGGISLYFTLSRRDFRPTSSVSVGMTRPGFVSASAQF